MTGDAGPPRGGRARKPQRMRSTERVRTRAPALAHPGASRRLHASERDGRKQIPTPPGHGSAGPHPRAVQIAAHAGWAPDPRGQPLRDKRLRSADQNPRERAHPATRRRAWRADGGTLWAQAAAQRSAAAQCVKRACRPRQRRTSGARDPRPRDRVALEGLENQRQLGSASSHSRLRSERTVAVG